MVRGGPGSIKYNRRRCNAAETPYPAARQFRCRCAGLRRFRQTAQARPGVGCRLALRPNLTAAYSQQSTGAAKTQQRPGCAFLDENGPSRAPVVRLRPVRSARIYSAARRRGDAHRSLPAAVRRTQAAPGGRQLKEPGASWHGGRRHRAAGVAKTSTNRRGAA